MGRVAALNRQTEVRILVPLPFLHEQLGANVCQCRVSNQYCTDECGDSKKCYNNNNVRLFCDGLNILDTFHDGSPLSKFNLFLLIFRNIRNLLHNLR